MNSRLLGAIAVLALMAAVFSGCSLPGGQDELAYQREAEVRIISDDERTETVDFDAILELQEHSFTVDRSDRDDNNSYTGVLLKELLASIGVDVDDAEQFIGKAADGYTVALPAGEVLDDDLVFIVYKINDEPLSPAAEGGSGPYRLVVKDDEFGQRWVKHLEEIVVR